MGREEIPLVNICMPNANYDYYDDNLGGVATCTKKRESVPIKSNYTNYMQRLVFYFARS